MKHSDSFVCPFCNGSKVTPFVRFGRKQDCTECNPLGFISGTKVRALGIEEFAKGYVKPEKKKLSPESNYKQDAEQWGNALNEAAEAFAETCPASWDISRKMLFNTCKPALREAIRVYLEAVERNRK